MVNDLLTLKDLALIFRVSPKTIRKWVERGRFPEPLHVGSRPLLRWHENDVLAFIEAHQHIAQERNCNGE